MYRISDKSFGEYLFVALILIPIIIYNLKDPYWNFSYESENPETQRCELFFDGWSWNLEAHYSKWDGDSYHYLKISQNILNSFTRALPAPINMGSVSEQFQLGVKLFWVSKYYDGDYHIVLAIDENDDEGLENSLYGNFKNEKSFLNQLMLTSEIGYLTYIDRKKAIRKIKVENRGKTEAIQKFLDCIQKIKYR